jgi:predicted nuclease of predicted toxin-antitoxin system
MRFLLNHNVARQVGMALSSAGHTYELAGGSARDVEIAQRARAVGAVVVTWDRDFDAVAAQYPDVGVVRFALPTQDPKVQASALVHAVQRGEVGPGVFVILRGDEPAR